MIVRVALLMFLFSLPAVEVRSDYGLPSEETLAAMGLSGMQVLTDEEAMAIRVSGDTMPRWGNLYPFVYGASRLEPGVRARGWRAPLVLPASVRESRLASANGFLAHR